MSEIAETVSEAIAGEFAKSGVTSVSGLIGEDTVALADSLSRRYGIPYCGVRHESVAVGMADGHSWAAGGVGVCLLSRGPGFANGIGSAVSAARGHRRIVIVTGDTPTIPVPTPDLKLLAASELAPALELAYVRIEAAADAERATRKAVSLAAAGQPCVLAIPVNLFEAAHPEEHAAGEDGTIAPAPAAEPAAEDLRQIEQYLAGAQLPLVLAGAGAIGAKAALVELAERTGALLGTTLLAKDLFRGHPHDFGVVGGFTPDHRVPLLSQVDFVLAVGASLSSYTTSHGRLFRGVPVIQVDIEQSALGVNYPLRLGVTGDAEQVIGQVLAHTPPGSASLPDTARSILVDEPSLWGTDTDDGHVDPRALSAALAQLLPDDVNLVLDGGHFMGFAVQHIRVSGPARFRHSSAFASIGQGLGIAMGVATARPGERTMLFIGDGGMLMTLGDLETLVRARLPVCVVVMNDHAYGAERHLLDISGKPNCLAKFPDTSFAAVAQALGIKAVTVRSVNDLTENLPDLRPEAGPLLLDCKIRPDVRARWIEEVAKP